jgi:hypothetical protein
MARFQFDRDDLARAVERMPLTSGLKDEFRALPSYLWDGETVLVMEAGWYEDDYGVVVLTDQRLIFLHKSWSSERVEDFLLRHRPSIEWSAGLLSGKVVVRSSGTRVEISGLDKDLGREIVDKARAISAGQSPSRPAPRAAPRRSAVALPGDDPDAIIEAIRQLGELRDLGILSDAEFHAKKAELLRRL